MGNYITGKMKHRHGFTLIETLLVVSIIAIIATIAIASILVIRNNLQFKQCNDNAYAIYTAAQTNLTEMRSMGELFFLEEAAADEEDKTMWKYPALDGSCCYTYSKHENELSYDLIVPSTVDTHIRNQQVIIEYHPTTGMIYSVFYYEGTDSLLDMYEDLSRFRDDADLRKDLQVGYYTVGDIDAINSEDFVLHQISADIAYSNSKEGTITVSVPVKDSKGFDMFTDVDAYNYIANRLEITLTITGENGGQIASVYQVADESGSPLLNYTPNYTQSEVQVEIPLDSLTKSFSILAVDNVNGTLKNPIAAGDNISVTADVTFESGQNDPILVINSATIAGINPMFHDLMDNPDYDATQVDVPGYSVKPYVLAISNGRHLQNLNYLDAEFARNIASIVFTKDDEETTGADDENSEVEEQNEGNESFVLTWYDDVTFTPVILPNIPTIQGNGVEIQNLKINASTGIMLGGSKQNYSGLFAALSDTTIENITLANSDISTSDAVATGGLIGYADGVTITNCHVTNTANSISGAGDIGGLVGLSYGSSFNKCTTNAIATGTANIGGLVGNSTDSRFTNCSTAATVTGSHVGGLVGLSSGSSFNECTTGATVTGYSSTASDVGGMVGYTDGSTFTNCSTSAAVTGSSGAASNVGGLIGSSKDTTLTSCVAESAAIASGSNSGSGSKNALGGMIGYATNSGTNTSFAIGSCESKGSVRVTGVSGSLNNLGGMVGYANNAFFTTCKSSAVVNGQSTNGDIPNNNLGGFVGSSVNTRYAVTDVTLNYLPQYAADAGGFAGVLSGDSVENLDVIFTGNPTAKTTITNFGGIASINSYNSTISLAAVTSKNASGTPDATFNQSQNTAGFVVTNRGNIYRSFSNVIMDKGACFVLNNSGTIRNCYGWAWDNDITYALDGCKHSYFANGNTGDVWFYDADGNLSDSIIKTGVLAQEETLALLNTNNKDGSPWAEVDAIPYPIIAGKIINGTVAGYYPAPVAIPEPDDETNDSDSESTEDDSESTEDYNS